MEAAVKDFPFPEHDDDYCSGDDHAYRASGDYLKIVEPLPVDAQQNEYTGCPVSIDMQIASLGKLGDGWYDEESRKYEPEELRWVARLLSSVLGNFTLPTPYIYPTPDGLVRAEWSPGNAEIILNIDLSSQSAEALAALVGSDDVDELPVAFADQNAERVLGLFLSRYLR